MWIDQGFEYDLIANAIDISSSYSYYWFHIYLWYKSVI
jgi:hypothetical protein